MSDLFDLSRLRRDHNFIEFPSIHAVIRADEETQCCDWFKDDEQSKRQVEKDHHFYGCPSWNYMQAVVKNGWTKGRASISASLDEVYSGNSASRSDGSYADYDVSGDYPDVDRYLAGDPEHMISYGSHIAAKPVIKLAVNVTASSNIPAEHLINRGSAVVALVDAIESNGNSVELTAVETSLRKKKNCIAVYAVALKKAGEVLSIDDIAFGLGHPDMLRRIFFSIMERDPWTEGKGYVHSYGTPTDLPDKCIPWDTVYLKGVCNDRDSYRTPQSAMAKVRELYESQAKAKGLAVA